MAKDPKECLKISKPLRTVHLETLRQVHAPREKSSNVLAVSTKQTKAMIPMNTCKLVPRMGVCNFPETSKPCSASHFEALEILPQCSPVVHARLLRSFLGRCFIRLSLLCRFDLKSLLRSFILIAVESMLNARVLADVTGKTAIMARCRHHSCSASAVLLSDTSLALAPTKCCLSLGPLQQVALLVNCASVHHEVTDLALDNSPRRFLRWVVILIIVAIRDQRGFLVTSTKLSAAQSFLMQWSEIDGVEIKGNAHVWQLPEGIPAWRPAGLCVSQSSP